MSLVSRIASYLGVKSAANQNFKGDWTIVGGSPDSVDERNLLANNKEWVFVAIDRIAATVTSINFQVKKYKANGDDPELFNGPLYDFLEAPGPGITGKDFIYLNTVYKELTGNAFWEKTAKGKYIPLIPTTVRPKIENGKMVAYEHFASGTKRIILLDELLHDKYIDPARPYWGTGKLQKIARWVDTGGFANEFLRQFFLNGAHFGGFIETEEESEQRIKLIKAGLVNDHVGVANSHKWGVLPKGSKATRMTANMSEIEMGATDDRYRDKILAGFGVPKSIVGLVEDVNRANAEANEYVFAKYTIKPIVEDLIEFLNVYVAKELDPSGATYFDYEEFVPVNMEIELKEREIALNRQPYKTVNEVRAEIGLLPVDGGDVVYGPPFQSPLGQPMAYPEPQNPTENDDEDQNEPVPAKSKKTRSRAAQGRVRAFENRETAKKSLVDDIATQLEGLLDNGKDLDPDELAHKDFVGRVESFLERMANAVRLFNSEQKSRVVQDLQRITKAVSQGDLFDFDQEVALMVNFVQPILRGLLTEQALAEYEAQGFEGVFDSGAEQLVKTVDLATKRLAKTYNKTTARLLKTALNQGITEGEGLADLTKRVAEIYEFSDTSRAKAVAHTESFYIANKGNLEAYRQSGVVKAHRWYTAEDERVCPWCEPQNGKIVDVDDNFFAKGETLIGSDGKPLRLDYRSIDVPPLHTNCRCFIRPEVIEIE